MKNSFNIRKVFYSFLLVAGLVLIVPAINYMSVALGFNAPTSNPPAGSGAISVGPTGNIGIATVAPTTAKLVITAVGQPGIDVDPSGSAGGSIIGLTATPTAPDEAASKAYVDAQAGNGNGGGGGGGNGGGSMVLFYKDVNNIPAPPSCPAGWTAQLGAGVAGYGPHYLGVFAHDWLQNGTGGTGGGFATGFTPPLATGPSGNGVTFVLNDVAIGSDSVCSTSQKSMINFSDIYNNAITSDFAGLYADACFTSTGSVECNRCVVCQK